VILREKIYQLLVLYLQVEGKTLNTKDVTKYFLYGQKNNRVSVKKKIATIHQHDINVKER